jgi:PTH1 family peptidyl-tRNA hydrolase
VGEEVVIAAAGSAFKRAPHKIRARIARDTIGGRPSILALPTTFMNESGAAVASLMRYFDPDRLVLVHDDIDLPFGKLRFHHGRGTGGHNGVASVVEALGGTAMWRLKVGVGRPPGRMDPAVFVLRRFTKKERVDVDLMVAEAVDVLRSFGESGEEAARGRAGEARGRLFGEPQ